MNKISFVFLGIIIIIIASVYIFFRVVPSTSPAVKESEYSTTHLDNDFNKNIVESQTSSETDIAADTSNFSSTTYKILANKLVTDGKYLYCNDKVVPGVDVSTLQQVATTSVENKELRYFAPLAFFDKDTYYEINNYLNEGECVSVTPIDIASFRHVDANYYKDKNSVYLMLSRVMTNESCILKDADPDTFEVFGDSWSKDSKHVFYDCLSVAGADPSSFSSYTGDQRSSGYAKDSKHVYFIEKACCKGDGSGSVSIVSGADPATFLPLGNSETLSYAKDGSAVYVEGIKFAIADVETFRLLSDSAPDLAIDENHLYVGDQVDGLMPVEGVDMETFKIKNTKYDDANAYYGYVIRASDKNRNYIITPDLMRTTVSYDAE